MRHVIVDTRRPVLSGAEGQRVSTVNVRTGFLQCLFDQWQQLVITNPVIAMLFCQHGLAVAAGDKPIVAGQINVKDMHEH